MNRAFRSIVATVFIFTAVWSAASAESSLAWREFNKNENTWISTPKGLMLFSTLTRTIKPVIIDATRPIDTIVDCIDYEDYLWVSSDAGLYQIDMASQSVERIPLPASDSTAVGKVAQDADYLWLGTNGKLLRFDKLGREWLSFALPTVVDRIVGLWSNGDEVFYTGDEMLYRFTVSTEKWTRYPYDKPFGAGAIFYPGNTYFKVLDGQEVSLYQPESFSWKKTSLGVVPSAVCDQDSVILYFSGTTVNRVSCETSLIRPLNIPNPGNVIALTASGDTLFMVTEKRIAKFLFSSEAVDFIEYDQQFAAGECSRISAPNGFLITFSPSTVSCYDKEVRTWKYIPRTGMRQRINRFTWNEEEFSIRYGRGIQSSMSGSLQLGTEIKSEGFDYVYSVKRRYETLPDGNLNTIIDSTVIDSEMLVSAPPPNVYGNLNFHTSDKNDRVADIFFNNTSIVTAPEKGLYYRGNRDDYLNSLRIGSSSNDQAASAIMPLVDMQGGGAVFEGRKRLATRDRKVVRLSGGSGYITTRTVFKVLAYRADGTYYLKEKAEADTVSPEGAGSENNATGDTTTIVPGSIEVIVDGEVLDPTNYEFATSIRKLQFNTNAPIDPVSIIMVRYQTQTIPEGDISNIEFIPSHHFGKLHFGALTVSPTDWISARVGFNGIDRDTLNPIMSISTPIELRNERLKLMLKANPDYNYNFSNKSQAGSLNLQSRFGTSTGIVFNGMFADSAFVSTDTLSRGYGMSRSEYDFKVSHDIRQELPLSYYQHQRYSADGVEQRFAFNAGAHFENLPFFDVALSRTGFDNEADDSVTRASFDSLFYRKDKVKFRLYETSSSFLQKLTRFSKVSYDISHAEYRTMASENSGWTSGRLSTALFTIAPIKRIVLSGNMLYRGGMQLDGFPTMDVKPSINLQMIDAPPGTDFTMIYDMNLSKFAATGSSTDTISRSFLLTLKPGQWFAPLGWFAPKAKLSQTVYCAFDSYDPSFMDLISGSNGRTYASLLRGVGVNLFPTDAILLTNMNEWTQSDSARLFKTTNRFQYLVDARNTFRADWTTLTDFTYPQHTGSFSFDKVWTHWLRTTPMISTDIVNNKNGNAIKAGPGLTVNIFFQNFGIIRTCSNIQNLKLAWKRVNGETDPVPDWGYRFSLRLKLKPNIEVVSDNNFDFNGGTFQDFRTKIDLFFYF